MSLSDFARRLQYLFHRPEHAADLDEEMRLHVELRAQQLHECGMTPDQARYAARREFGNRAAIEIAGADAWGWGWWERLAQDVRYAARSIAKAPGFAAIAVATLAVGIGMNTAVFSIVNAVMLRSLPYSEPDRLVSIWERNSPVGQPVNMGTSGPSRGVAGGTGRSTVSPANLMDYRSGTSAFEGLAGVDALAMNLTGNGPPERLTGERVTANYFSVLGVTPEMGRTFSDDEDREGGNRVVVLTHRFWQRRLGGDQTVLGQSLMLDAKPYLVIGVLPASFQPATQFAQTVPVNFLVP